MALQFAQVSDTSTDLLMISESGECPHCGVQATTLIPKMRLRDQEGDVVFHGCVECLDRKIKDIPEAQALLRAVLLVHRNSTSPTVDSA